MIRISFFLVVFSLALLGCSDAKASISGLYAGGGLESGGQKALYQALRITQDGRHHLIGSIETEELTKEGNIKTSSYNLTGILDGSNLTLTIENGLLKSSWPNRTGTIHDGVIHLSWNENGNASQATFKKTTESQYNATLAKLSSISTRLKAHQQHKEVAHKLQKKLSYIAKRSRHWNTKNVVTWRSKIFKRYDKMLRLERYYKGMNRACPRFCVNGSLAGHCRLTRRHHDLDVPPL